MGGASGVPLRSSNVSASLNPSRRGTAALGVLVGGNLSRQDHGRQASMMAGEISFGGFAALDCGGWRRAL